MRKERKPRPGYIFTHSRDGHYWHTAIRLLRDYTSTCGRTKELTIKWQSDDEDTRGEWSLYGQRHEMEFEYPDDGLDLMRLHQRLFGELTRKRAYGEPESPGYSPITILQALIGHQKWIDQIVYDQRVSYYLPIKEVLPPTYKAWRDDYHKCGFGSGCTVGCVAEDEDEARRLLTKEFVERDGAHYKTRFETWLEHGRPCLELWDYKPPEIYSVEQALSLLCEDKSRRDAEAKARWEREQKEWQEKQQQEEAEKQQEQQTETQEPATA